MAFIFARHYLRPSAALTLQRQPSYSLAITTYLPAIYLSLQWKGKSTHSQHLQWEEEELNHGDSNPRPSACYTSMLLLSHRDFPVVGAADSRSKLKGDRIQDRHYHMSRKWVVLCKDAHAVALYPIILFHHWLFSIFTFLPLLIAVLTFSLLTFYHIRLFHRWLFSIFTFLPLTFCRFDF